MNYTEWMERTNRGLFKPRSTALRLVDSELRRLSELNEMSRMPALREALNQWKTSHGVNWKDSIRNHDGAVEELDKLVNGNPSVFAQAAAAARTQQQLQNVAGVNVNQQVKQKFGDNDPTFRGTEFKWNIVMRLVKRGTCIEAKVRVAGQMHDETASAYHTVPPAEKSAFRTHITSAWNIATVVSKETNRTRYYDLLFDLEWVDATDPVPKYTININKLHPATPNRDNLKNWLYGNREACIHEFGHMIGCPDEYNTVAVQGFGHRIEEAAMYNQAGYTTDSIMNNPGPTGRIHERHFNFVGRYCRQILKTDTSVKILRRIGPSEVEEVRQMMVAHAHGRRQALGFDDD